MKKIALVIASLFTGILGYAQASHPCSDLIISEYVEGWSDNKALELYNPTNHTIDLSNYQLHRWTNGETNVDPTHVIRLGGSIGSLHTYVIVIDLTDTTATGFDTCAYAALLAQADTLLCPNYDTNSTTYWNGDDGVALEVYNSSTFPNGVQVDLMGKIGDYPTNGAGTHSPNGGWTNISPFDTGVGEYWTKDHTLIRKDTVTMGITIDPAYFDPSAEWDSLPVNTFDHLRWHVCVCGTLGIDKVQANSTQVNVYPNPAMGFAILNSEDYISAIEVKNIYGQSVRLINNGSNSKNISIDTKDLATGMYFVDVIFKDNRRTVQKLIVQ